MKDAIEKAIGGGWIAKCCVEPEKNWQYYKGDILIDPFFWRGLGKSLGWIKNEIRNEPLEYWMRFIFYLDTNKDPDSFFTSLLNQTEK